MATTRQQIVAEMLARVAAISIANGYQTDAGLRVFGGETPQLGPDDPDAAIAVLVRPDIPGDLRTIVATVLPLDIQAVAKADLDNVLATIEAVVADIRKAIESGSRSLGGLLTRDLLRGSTRYFSRPSGSTVIGAGVEYRATFQEGWGA